MDLTIATRLLKEFEAQAHVYNDFARVLEDLVGRVIAPSRIATQSITVRTKTQQSLRRKLTNPARHYTALGEITDLVGVRIITYFEPDVQAVAAIVESEFAVDTQNSADKTTLLDPDRFGYRSVHYIVELPPERCCLTEYRHLAGLKAEIQIRSVLQHAWAEIEHDLGYKLKESVPVDIRRRFSRIAGLLELADGEFSGIRASLAQYAQEMPRLLKEDPESIPVDKISVDAMLRLDENAARLDRAIAGVGGGGLVYGEEYVEYCVRWMRWLGIPTIADIQRLLESEGDLVVAFAKAFIRSRGRVYQRGISLFYLAHVRMAAASDEAKLTEFAARFGVGHPTPEAAASRVMDAYRQAAETLREPPPE